MLIKPLPFPCGKVLPFFEGRATHCSPSVKKLTDDEVRGNTSLEEGKYLLGQKGPGLRKFPSNVFKDFSPKILKLMTLP